MRDNLPGQANISNFRYYTKNCDALRDLVPFAQFEKRHKQSWRSVTFSEIAGFRRQLYRKEHSPMDVFLIFKLYKWYQITQRITTESLLIILSASKIRHVMLLSEIEQTWDWKAI